MYAKKKYQVNKKKLPKVFVHAVQIGRKATAGLSAVLRCQFLWKTGERNVPYVCQANLVYWMNT